MIVKHFITVSSQNNKIKVKFLVTPSICCKQWHSMRRTRSRVSMHSFAHRHWCTAVDIFHPPLHNIRIVQSSVRTQIRERGINWWVIRFNSCIRCTDIHWKTPNPSRRRSGPLVRIRLGRTFISRIGYLLFLWFYYIFQICSFYCIAHCAPHRSVNVERTHSLFGAA